MLNKCTFGSDQQVFTMLKVNISILLMCQCLECTICRLLHWKDAGQANRIDVELATCQISQSDLLEYFNSTAHKRSFAVILDLFSVII